MIEKGSVPFLRAIVGGVAFAVVMQMTSGMVDAADGFFQAIMQRNLAKARSFLAQETRQKLDDKTLKEFMEVDTLARYKEVSFPNRQISGDRGEVNGTITTTSGGVGPVRVVMVQEGDVWKVYSFQTAK